MEQTISGHSEQASLSKSADTITGGRIRGDKKPRELGAGDTLGAGDSQLITDILPLELSEVVFDKLREEVKWSTMLHRGGEVPRLVAVEGEVEKDGSFPIYRHPADESPRLLPFSPTVSLVREAVQNVGIVPVLDQRLISCHAQILKHPVNHALIQYYRSGKDYISEHSDKTIDVVRGTNIANVSIGAQRVMVLRTKRDKPVSQETDGPASRNTQRIPLPHNSMFVMGPQTNKEWLHGINHDNRPFQTKSEAERFNNGERISLTFRFIGTFLTADEKMIYGQGAKGKTREEARPVVLGTAEAAKLIQAFGEENQRSDFDWEANYGMGYDVLHFNPS